MQAIKLDPKSIDDYRKFLRIKALPNYEIRGRMAYVPDEYAATLEGGNLTSDEPFDLHPQLFDYQSAISRIAIRKRRFAVFARCGLGKTLMLLEFARHASRVLPRKSHLIISPLMVIDQTIEECQKWYNFTPERIESKDLNSWLAGGQGIGITNYEALRNEVEPGNIGSIACDEASLLKSAYGKYGAECIRLAKSCEWRLSLTGTPAPNDRIEYGNQAVFLGQFPTLNSFLARYFINRGQTKERWELRPHALRPFYRSLSHWCIFLNDPSVYGWKDNADTLPPIMTTIHDVELTTRQSSEMRQATGQLLVNRLGGITTRQKMARLAKGADSLKPAFMAGLVASWQATNSTLIWCKYNDEQDNLAKVIPGAESISGDTSHEKRMDIIRRFKSGEVRTIISKPKVLGYGLNLQKCTRMIFSTLQDSYEEYWQAICRANRVGSTEPLQVHIPTTDIERPMIENVLRKAKNIDADLAEQESLFREQAQEMNYA